MGWIVLFLLLLLSPAVHAQTKVTLSQEDIGLCNTSRFSNTRTGATIATALASTGTTTLPDCSGSKTLLIAPGAWTISADLTIPARVRLSIPAGTVITVTAGTLTLQTVPECDIPVGCIVTSGSGAIAYDFPAAQKGKSFVTNACLPAVPGSGVTLGAFACDATIYAGNVWPVSVRQAAAAVGALTASDGTYWIAVHKDTTSPVTGWTRQSGTHYIWKQNATQPTAPADSMVIAGAVITGCGSCNITAIIPTRVPLSQSLSGMSSITDPLYNAVGDNSTINTSGIQAALNDASSGRRIFVPPGTYLIDAALVIKSSGTHIICSKGASLKANAATFSILTFTSGISNITIEGCTFTGAATNGTTTQYAIQSTVTTSNVIIRDNVIDSTNNGISVYAGTNWIIQNNVLSNLYGTGSGTGYGVLSSDGGRKLTVANNSFTAVVDRGRHGIYITSDNQDSNVIGNHITGFANSGIAVAASAAQPGVLRLVVQGNIVTGGVPLFTDTAGISFDGNIKDSTIKGNSLINVGQNASFPGDGILVNDAGSSGANQRNVVSGNSVISSGGFGIRFAGTKDCIMTGNTVYNAGVSATRPGIEVTSAASFGTEVNTNTIVIGNVSRGTGQRSAIRLNTSAPVPTGAIITGNMWGPGSVVTTEYNTASVTASAHFNTGDDPQVLAKPQIVTGVSATGSGVKHTRINTGTVGTGARADVVVTWGTAFADANYTVSASILETSAAGIGLVIERIRAKTAAAVTIQVFNASAAGLGGTIDIVAIHD